MVACPKCGRNWSVTEGDDGAIQSDKGEKVVLTSGDPDGGDDAIYSCPCGQELFWLNFSTESEGVYSDIHGMADEVRKELS